MLVRHVYILSSWYGVIIFFLKNTFFIFFLLEMYVSNKKPTVRAVVPKLYL